MYLYVCMAGTAGKELPGPLNHPCGRAAHALDAAGHRYDVKQVGGGSLAFWTWRHRARDRAEVERLSGQRFVPILLLDDGEVVTGAGAIVSWAQSNPAA